MLVVPESLKMELKMPLGDLMQMPEFLSRYRSKKIVAVGDVIAASLLENGITPFIAVYDFRSMRKKVGDIRARIKEAFPEFSSAKNPAGTITEELKDKAQRILLSGGALFVEGEEDLAALVFMRICPKGCIIAYGQPAEGIVAVECGPKSREKAEAIFGKMGNEEE
jgi:GTP-dependent dephospho-CoA kinase